MILKITKLSGEIIIFNTNAIMSVGQVKEATSISDEMRIVFTNYGSIEFTPAEFDKILDQLPASELLKINL